MPLERTVLVVASGEEIDRHYRPQIEQDQNIAYTVIATSPEALPLPRPAEEAEGAEEAIDVILLAPGATHPPCPTLIDQLTTALGDRCPPLVVIDRDDTELAVQALKGGATDYLVRDRTSPAALRQALAQALGQQRELDQTRIPKPPFLNGQPGGTHGMRPAEPGVASQDLGVDLQHTVATLQHQRYKLQQLIDNAPVGIAVSSATGQITTMNAAMLRLYDYSPQDLEQGLHWPDLVPSNPAIAWQPQLEQQQGLLPQQIERLRADGTRISLLLSGMPWLDAPESDGSQEYVIFAVDVSAQKQAEMAVQRLNCDLTNRVAELHSLLDLTPVGIAIATDASCTQMQHNAYLRQLLGVPRGQNISKSALEPPPYQVFWQGQEVAVADLPMQRAARLGLEVRDVELEVVLANGTVRQVLGYATPLNNGQGQVRGVVGTFVDITDRNRNAAALKASEQRYRDLAEAMPQMVWRADAAGAVNYWNQQWYDYTGLSEAESLATTAVSAVHPADRDRTLASWSEAIRRQEPLEIEYRVRHHSGDYHWFICRAVPYCDSHHHITQWIGTLTNIDDIKRNEALRQQNERQIQRQLAEIEAIYQTAPIGLNVLDPDLRFVRINQRLADMNGLSVEAHLGQTVRELFPALADTIEHLLRPLLETGEPLLNVEIQGELPAQPGVQRTWLEHFVPLKLGDRIVGISTVCEEITDRIRIETALRESEERYRTLFESMDEGFCVIEVLFDSAGAPIDYRFIEINPAFEQQTGLTHAIGQRVLELDPNHERYWFEVYGQVVTSGSASRFEGYAAALNRWFDVYAFPTGPTGGAWVAVLFSDITQRKQAQQEREQLLVDERAARAEAERANRIKDEFMAVLSHELRSPLNPILGWTKLLQAGKLDAAKTAAALATIERNVQLQTQLIDDLLDVAKILRGKLSLHETPVDLAFVVEAAMETVRVAAAAKSITLHPHLTPTDPVLGDTARLQQIVWNLLSNAIKFTPSGGRVDIHLTQVDNQAQITITDTGRGISPDFLPHIFESFRQEDASITRQHGGLGLGLAIVYQLAEAHGGTITAASEGLGQGTTFTVALPRLALAPPSPSPPSAGAMDLNLRGLRVLAVDDEADTRDLLSALLGQYGAEVVTVASAPEALAQIATFRPNVLVSDIGMPGVDGYTLIEKVRALPAAAGGNLPALALTAYAREDDSQRAIASGFQRHLAKPLDPERLVQAIVTLAGQS